MSKLKYFRDLRYKDKRKADLEADIWNSIHISYLDALLNPLIESEVDNLAFAIADDLWKKGYGEKTHRIKA